MIGIGSTGRALIVHILAFTGGGFFNLNCRLFIQVNDCPHFNIKDSSVQVASSELEHKELLPAQQEDAVLPELWEGPTGDAEDSPLAPPEENIQMYSCTETSTLGRKLLISHLDSKLFLMKVRVSLVLICLLSASRARPSTSCVVNQQCGGRDSTEM